MTDTSQPELTSQKSNNKLLAAFSSLQVSNYRKFFVGVLLTLLALNMQILARGWLIYEMTNSAFMLGLITGAYGVTMVVVTPIGGVIADRISKKKLIIYSEIVLLLSAILMSILILTNHITVWMVFVLSVIQAIANSLELPSRTAIVSELLEEKLVINGITLNNIAQNIGRIVGPSLAGVLVGFTGVGGVFVIISIMYMVVIITISMITLTSKMPQRAKTSPVKDLTDGFAYTGRHFIILILMIFGAMVSIFGLPYTALLPIFAKDILNMGAAGLGILSSAAAIGSLIGLIGLAILSNVKRKGLLLICAVFSFSLSVIVFSLSTNFILSCIFMAILGATLNVALVMNQSMIQISVEPEVRGRVLSIFVMTWGLQALGTIPIGALAEVFGAPTTLAMSGSLLALLAVSMYIFVPRLRKA